MLVAHGVYVPNEIIYSFGLVPLHLENVTVTYSIVTAEQPQMLAAAKSFGLTPEVCSNHRIATAFFLNGYSPPVDAVIWTHILCDNTAKVGQLICRLYDAPGFFLDRPYKYNERELAYFVGELEDLIAFLEGLTGRRFDMGELDRALRYSHRMVEIAREVDELRRLKPSPVSNRKIYQLLFIHWIYAGTPEGVKFYEAVLEELRERARHHRDIPERFRILSLFVAPNYYWKLLDWMEWEYGARIVADPYHCHWGEWHYDPSHPLESLARKLLVTPACKQLHGFVEELVADAVADAETYGAEAAIYWASLTCRESCATIRTVKDALADKGLPTLVLDNDVSDPSVVPGEQLKEKMEAFFEVLEESL